MHSVLVRDLATVNFTSFARRKIKFSTAETIVFLLIPNVGHISKDDLRGSFTFVHRGLPSANIYIMIESKGC